MSHRSRTARIPSSEKMYDRHAEQVLVPLSRAATLHEAIKEWYCDGEVYDFETASHWCELRSTGPSRFLLEMRHRDNGCSLRINVSTALVYGITIYGDNHLPIKQSETKRYLREKLRICTAKQHYLNFCTAVLRDADAIKYLYLLRLNVAEPVLPSHLISIAKFMASKRLDFDVSPFVVDLESGDGWRQFVMAPPWLRWKIWRSLSDVQLAKCKSQGLVMAKGYEQAPSSACTPRG